METAQFRNADPGGEKQLNDGKILKRMLFLEAALGVEISLVNGINQLLDGMQRHIAGEPPGFPEAGVEFMKGVGGILLFFSIMVKCFQRGNFAPDGRRRIFLVKDFQITACAVFVCKGQGAIPEPGLILLQVGPVGAQGFGIQSAGILTVVEKFFFQFIK